ncbi:hypothetical protein C8F01DRAFT_1231078 [Mycena amicta]|nr:hypothetical protein C8F01DRAFT_1231078 [Mycena amicta]
MSLGSSFIVTGFFPLTAGSCVGTTSTSTIFHAHYTTAIKTANGTFLAAKLPAYSGSSSNPLPDNSLAFAIAKVFAPAGHDAVVELETLHFVPFPGDSAQSGVPDAPSVFMAVGNVPAAMQIPEGWKAFTLSMREWINNGPRLFPLICVFPNTNRWAKTNPPLPLTSVGVVGTCGGRFADGTLQINIDHIAFNIGPAVVNPVTSSPVGGPGPSPSTPQHLKYQFASTTSAYTPSPPVASTSQLYPITALPGPPAPYTPIPQRGAKRRRTIASPGPSASNHEDDYTEPEDEEAEPLGKGKRAKKATGKKRQS